MTSKDQRTHSPLAEQLLRENGYRLVKLPQSGNNIFAALSTMLYFTDTHHQRLKMLAVEGLKIHFMSRSAKNKPLLENCDVARYVSNPRLPQFEPITLDIIAELFGIKIKLYYVNELNLCSDTYNSIGLKSFKLFKVHDFHYEPLVTRRKLGAMTLVQDVVLGIVESALNKSKGAQRTVNNNAYINFTLKRWNTETLQRPFGIKAALYTERDTTIRDNDSNSCASGEGNIRTAIENFEEMYNELLVCNQESHDFKDSKDSIEKSFDDLTYRTNVNNLFDDEGRSCGINFYEEVPIKDFGSTNSDTDVGMYNMRRQIINKGIDSDDDMQLLAMDSPIKRKKSARVLTLQNNDYEQETMEGMGEQFNTQWDDAELRERYGAYGYHPQLSSPVSSRKVSIEENKTYAGVFKFFDEKNNFGFITLIDYPTVDVFVFGSEFQKSKIPVSVIKAAKYGHIVKFQFEIVFYWGRHGKSKKAVNIRLI